MLLPQLMQLTVYLGYLVYNIRIYQECKGAIEKSVPRNAVWVEETCLVMTNGDSEGQIFLSHTQRNNGFFFMLTIKYRILCLNKANSTNLYPPAKGYLRDTCKSQNINPIYLTLSSPTVSFRS